MKKIFPVLAAAMVGFAATACGGGDPSQPPTIVSFAQVGPACDENSQVTLTWTLGGGATGVTISIDGPGIYDTYPGTTRTEKFPGACEDNPSQTFLLTTIGGTGGPATETIVLTYEPPPPPTIVSFAQVGPACDENSQVTLTWTLGGGATGATISIDGPGIYDTYPGTTRTEQFPGACPVSNPVQTFLLRTIGGSGPAAEQTIVVTAPAPVSKILSFQRIGPACDGNGQVTLSWTLGNGATGATISIDGPGIYDTYPGTSRTEQFPGACGEGNTQTFLLTTIGGAGSASTRTIVVNPDPSVIL